MNTSLSAKLMASHWDILVDLCTEGEGVSDLVLTGKIVEVNDQYSELMKAG